MKFMGWYQHSPTTGSGAVVTLSWSYPGGAR